MRKHFLLLFLMALLPLVGWAQGVNLSDGWTIELSTPTATYDGTDKTPIVTLKKNEQTIAADKFIAVWKKGDEVVNELIDANPVQGYTVTVTANGTDTYAELAQPTKKFYILKATPTFATSGTTPKGALKSGGNYSSLGYSLIETEPTVTFGQSTILYKVTDSNTAPASDAEGWVTKADIAKVYTPGDYYVWFKIPATANYVEFISAVGGVDGEGKATSNLTITGIDITTNDFTAPVAITTTTFDYDDAEHAVFTTPGSWGTKPVLGTFKYTIDGGTTWSETIPTVKNVASYTVNYMIKGKDGHNDYTPTTSFTVVVNPTDAAQISFAATQGKANLTYNAGDQALLSSAATADLGATPTYKVKYSATNLDDNGWSTVTDETPYEKYDLVVGKNAGFYRIEALVANGGNYKDIVSKFITVEIQKAKLYVTTKAETKVYGEPDPAFTIAEYRGFQGNDWYENDATVTPAKVQAAGFSTPTITRVKEGTKDGQNVGTYKISASAGAADNYEFDFTEAAGKSVFNNLTIEKKVLNKTDFTFTLDDATLTYDGKEKKPAITAATYNKYDGTNNVNVDNLATTTADLNSPADYAFTYQYNVNAGDDVAQCIITGQNNFDGSIVLTFDIAKADIYVLPLAAEKNYGTADPTDVATAFAGEANPSVYQYKLVDANNVEVPGAVLNGTVKLQREAGEAVSNYKIYFKSYTPDANVADNYDVKNTDVLANETATNRTALFNLKKASDGLNLRFKSTAIATKVYGDGTPKWTIDDLEPVPGNEGFVPGDDWDKVKPTLSAPVFKLASENVSYANNQVTVSNLASTNYPTVTVQPLAFTVTKRPIAITVQPQTRDYGADPEQDEVGGSKWIVDDTKSYKNLTSPQGEPIASANQVGDALVGSDVVSVLGIQLYLEKDPYSYAAGQTHTEVIKARITAENSNYELNDNCVWGDLTVNAVNAFVLNFTDENLATKIATQAATGEEKPIMFGPMTLNAKEWYAVVLPFNTTPAELVQKLGEYVVVNKLSSSKLGSKGEAVINFSMEWDEIKAGEPFVIKASKEINLQGKTFDARKIFAGFEEKSTDKATFKGNYETGKMVWLNHNLDGTEAADKHYRWLSHTGAAKYKVDADGNIVPNGTYTGEGSNNWKTAESAPHYLAPMEAYLELTSDVAYARIFVEDFENGVTAIKSLSADEVNGLKIAEGWYTIDGIRLQSAPTQKGIYINNGKKVVVK